MSGTWRVRNFIVVTRSAPRYNSIMIKSFRHKGLQLFFETGSTAKIQPKHAKSLRFRLELLNRVEVLSTLPPQLKLHPLKGNQQGRWAISVSGNWRLTFEFKDGDVYILDYEDYH
jgi:toxin HigB-1